MGQACPALREAEFSGLALEFLCLKSQIPSTKSQINLKFQYSMTKTFQDETLFGFSNFGHWKLPALLNKS
jgi:hypothetical protein